MTALPNPFLSNFASAEGAPAAASIAPTPMQQPEAPIDDMDCIGEIFHHARMLIAEDKAVHNRFVPRMADLELAMLDDNAPRAPEGAPTWEEPPLFLRSA